MIECKSDSFIFSAVKGILFAGQAGQALRYWLLVVRGSTVLHKYSTVPRNDDGRAESKQQRNGKNAQRNI